jgi:hypothetical protein
MYQITNEYWQLILITGGLMPLNARCRQLITRAGDGRGRKSYGSSVDLGPGEAHGLAGPASQFGGAYEFRDFP